MTLPACLPRVRRCLAGLALTAAAASAWAQDEALQLYLETSIDGKATGAIVPVRRLPGGRLVAAVRSLREVGLDTARLGLDDRTEVDLGAVPGLRVSFDPARQSLELSLEPGVRARTVLQAGAQARSAQGDVSPGIVVNYDLFARLDGGHGVTALSEVRWFGAHGALSSSGHAGLGGAGDGRSRYLRYDTVWTRSDPATLSSLLIGDFVTPALDWTRSYRMAGVQWRKNFALRPGLATYPAPSIDGSAVVPSEVSLYLDGVRQMSGQVEGGAFVVEGIGGLSGAGLATLVVKDAAGRTVTRAVPLYVDFRLLAPGLTDYALSAGVLRRDYGVASFHYAGNPVAVATLRHGLSELLTLETHVEVDRSLLNASGGGLIRLGNAGVASAALAISAGRQRGARVQLGYQYVARQLALTLQATRASGGYSDLGSLENRPADRASDRANLSWSHRLLGSTSATYLRYQRTPRDRPRLASLAWSHTLGKSGYVSLSAWQDLGRPDARGVSMSLSFALSGRISASASVGRQEGAVGKVATLSRAPDFEGGFGWHLQAGSGAAQRFEQAQVQYLGTKGSADVAVQRSAGTTSAHASASGSLVAMGGRVFAARHAGQAFAVVATGRADVPVSHENRVIGRTDANGHLLVPNLVPYAGNLIAIDTSSLPADTRTGTTSMQVTPRGLSGVLAAFPVERYRAVTVLLHDAAGVPMAPGTPVRLAGSGAATVVGYDGMVFVDGVADENRLRAGTGAQACEARFTYRPDPAGDIPLIGPVPCLSIKGKTE